MKTNIHTLSGIRTHGLSDPYASHATITRIGTKVLKDFTASIFKLEVEVEMTHSSEKSVITYRKVA
jgi:hypothetical protein